MALENLTAAEFASLKSGVTVGEIEKLHKGIKTVGGKKILPGINCDHWPLLRMALIAAKMFTPPKVDKIIDKVIEAGDNVCPS